MFFTDRQLKVLGFVDGYTRTHGHAPTLHEIASHFRFSKISALGHLRALEKKKAIRRVRHQRRGIELLEGSPIGAPRVTTMPVAGEFIDGAELRYVHRPIDFDVASVVPTEKNGHIVRVVGSALVAAGFEDGDLIVIEPRGRPAPGELVLAAIDRGLAILGRFKDQPDPHLVTLDGRSIPFDQPQVRGIVRAMLRILSPASTTRPNA